MSHFIDQEVTMSRTNILIAAVLCLVLGASVGLAQGWYLSANAGYGLGAGTQALGENYTSTGTTSTSEGVYGSFGEGFKFGASAGYMASSNLGADIGFSYLLGNSFEQSDKSQGATSTAKASGSGFLIVPSIVVSADMNSIKPYAKLGLVIGFMKVTEELNDSFSGQTYDRTIEETGNLAFGYAGAFGIVVPSGGTVDFFAEVGVYSITYSPGQAEITKATANGVDQLSTLTQKVMEYKDSIASTDQNSGLSVRRAFSSLGINAGVRINL